MPLHSFYFHVPEKHFPAHTVTKPFFMRVEYQTRNNLFIGVLNIEVSFEAIGSLHLSHNLRAEIQDAAMANYFKVQAITTKQTA